MSGANHIGDGTNMVGALSRYALGALVGAAIGAGVMFFIPADRTEPRKMALTIDLFGTRSGLA